jgi:deoxyribodipyrimidine photo-lyase
MLHPQPDTLRKCCIGAVWNVRRFAAVTMNIFWFRNDLRLADNSGLAAALARGEKTALVYVLDDNAAGNWAMCGASRWWLHHSLESLGRAIAACGGRLILRRGDAGTIIPELAAQLKVNEVHAGRRFEPWARDQDRAVAAILKTSGIELRRHLTSYLFAPEQITTKSGGIYGVYTPFSRACLERAPPAEAIAAPSRISSPSGMTSDALEDWQLLPQKPDWAAGIRAAWEPGEAGAAKRLRHFVRQVMHGYNASRDIPGEDGTSGLSPHLHFGEISPATVWREAAGSAKAGQGREVFLKELLWREFAAYLLWHHPAMPEQPLRPEFAAMPWRVDEQSLAAWQRGLTGIPIVDAGMRQLWQTGWMHNRIRMVCASFLTKHLLIPWQQGEAWFWDTLVDADLASNAISWQWVAGCGADAAPYFRIFNPVLQGQKFDPGGAYVRKFVPELARLPDKFIHAPWEAEAQVLAAANVTLGQNYPHPIISLAQGRERALAAYKQITGTPAADLQNA